MDIKAYIESGVLEAYVLDCLPPGERAEVEELLAKYPELSQELLAIEESLELVSVKTGIAPPADLKDSIFAQLERDNPSVEEVDNTGESRSIETPIIPIQEKRVNVWQYVAAACIVLTLVSGYLAQDYHSKWKDSREAYSQLQAQNQQMADQYNRVNNRLDQLAEDIDVISSEDFARINMGSVIEGESWSASIYWNTKTQEAYLNIENLRALSEDQQYQLWAIVDGKPVDLGVFDFNEQGLKKMKSVANAATFAVTIEPKGGSENPTLDAMQVAGNVG